MPVVSYLSTPVWLFALAAVWLSACGGSGSRPLLEISGPTMGTRYSVKLVTADLSAEDDLTRVLDRELTDINALMSTWDPESELSRFNASRSTDWIAVSSRTVAVLEAALEISLMTAGAFDVTVGPLVNLWGFGPDPVTLDVPSATAVASAKTRVGYQFLAVREMPPAIRKSNPDVYVDLSAIAKGYAVDALAATVAGRGYSDFLVEIGGEIRTGGFNASGGPWRVAVERPVAGQRTVQSVIYPGNAAVATSGDYRNFFEANGVRYAHTIDPRTGMPVTHDLASVTVIDESAMRADALATALLVLGPEQGMALADSNAIAALFVLRIDGGFSQQPTRAFLPYLEPDA